MASLAGQTLMGEKKKLLVTMTGFVNVAGMLATPIRSDNILIIAFTLRIGHMIKETTMRTDLLARCP